jgi:hypothetical protein
MRSPLRRAIASLREAGLSVSEVRQGGRHTTIVTDAGLIRLHRGTRMKLWFERELRSAIRRLTEESR